YKNNDPKDLALRARVDASSSAKEYGAGPESKGFHQGLYIWKDQPQYTDTVLHTRRGQLIAIGDSPMESVSICVTNRSPQSQTLRAKLLAVDHIWDYRIQELDELASGTIEVPPGAKQWVDFPVNSSNIVAGRFVRLDILPNEYIEWLLAGKIVTGHMASYQIGPDKMRRFGSGQTLSFKVNGPQTCYEPANVINGVARPAAFTNLWKSDPVLPLPQWIGLTWDDPKRIDQIQLTFAGHLLRELHAYAPFYRDPQC